MDEFGETRTIYVWPKDHQPGDPYPEGFMARLDAALTAAGIDWETI